MFGGDIHSHERLLVHSFIFTEHKQYNMNRERVWKVFCRTERPYVTRTRKMCTKNSKTSWKRAVWHKISSATKTDGGCRSILVYGMEPNRRLRNERTNENERNLIKAVITIAIRLRYDYGVSGAPCFHSTRFDARKKWALSIFRRSRIVVIVISQSNRRHIVISITSVVVECIAVSS